MNGDYVVVNSVIFWSGNLLLLQTLSTSLSASGGNLNLSLNLSLNLNLPARRSENEGGNLTNYISDNDLNTKPSSEKCFKNNGRA